MKGLSLEFYRLHAVAGVWKWVVTEALIIEEVVLCGDLFNRSFIGPSVTIGQGLQVSVGRLLLNVSLSRQTLVLALLLQVLVEGLPPGLKVLDDAVGDGTHSVDHNAGNKQAGGLHVAEGHHAHCDGGNALHHSHEAGGDGRVDVGALERGEVHGTADDYAEGEDA